MKRLAAALPAVAVPAPAFSCTVCFGGDNVDVLRAFNWGFLLLISFTFLILGCFVVAVYRMETRRNADASQFE